MRGTVAKRLRRLGLRAGPVKREEAKGAALEAILERIVRTRLKRDVKHPSPGAIQAAEIKRERRAARNRALAAAGATRILTPIPEGHAKPRGWRK